MRAKLINSVAVALVVAGVLFLFVGLDSEPTPSSLRFARIGYYCALASIAVWILGIFVSQKKAEEKRKANQAVDPTPVPARSTTGSHSQD
jgi:threonine/homoserine efflux transporter RhtA